MAKAKRRSRTVPAVLPCWRPQAQPRSLRPRSITSREQVHVVEADLRLKHRDMAGSLFAFLRATFYRWSQLWKEVCPDLTDAPRLLAVATCMWRISEHDATPKAGWYGVSTISVRSQRCPTRSISSARDKRYF